MLSKVTSAVSVRQKRTIAKQEWAMEKMLGVVWLVLAGVSSLLAQEPSCLQHTLIGHDKMIFHVAFSPDGRTLASGSPQKARLWDVATGKNTATLDDAGFVCSVAFSQDGRLLALSTAYGEQGTVKLWDVATRKNTAILKTYNFGSFMTFGLDGKTLLWADNMVYDPDSKTWVEPRQTTIKRWDIGADKNTSICSICKSEEGFRMVVALAFSPDGKTLAARDDKGIIEIWNMTTGKNTATLFDNTGSGPFSVAFSPDGKTIASGGADKTIKFWDVITGKDTAATLRGHSAEVFSVAFSPDGKTLASCGYEKTVKLWDVATGKNIANLDTGSIAVNCVVFSPDGKTLASAGHDGTIKLWNVAMLEKGPKGSGVF